MARTGKLMAAAEIGRLLGVGRTRVKVLARRADFPAPLDDLDVGRIWLAEDVEAWAREHRAEIAEDPES